LRLVAALLVAPSDSARHRAALPTRVAVHRRSTRLLVFPREQWWVAPAELVVSDLAALPRVRLSAGGVIAVLLAHASKALGGSDVSGVGGDS